MGESEDETGRDARRPERRQVRADGRQIRALAHPLRARLLGELRLDGPATATALARKLGTNTGATSYHLRQLAEVGLVTEETERGTARQRWWRAAHDVTSWRSTDFDDDPDASAASDWIQSYQVTRTAEESQRWVAAQHDWPYAWREAAGFSDYLLRLTPGQLRTLSQEIWRVVERYDREPPAVAEDVEEARQVAVFWSGFPRLPSGPPDPPASLPGPPAGLSDAPSGSSGPPVDAPADGADEGGDARCAR